MASQPTRRHHREDGRLDPHRLRQAGLVPNPRRLRQAGSSRAPRRAGQLVGSRGGARSHGRLDNTARLASLLAPGGRRCSNNARALTTSANAVVGGRGSTAVSAPDRTRSVIPCAHEVAEVLACDWVKGVAKEPVAGRRIRGGVSPHLGDDLARVDSGACTGSPSIV